MKGRNGTFSERERAAVYRAIFERRDVRRNFLPAPIPEAMLAKLLTAAHHAGSVGFMQPWDFVIIRDTKMKMAVKNLFLQANAEAAAQYNGRRSVLYRHLKLQPPGELTLPISTGNGSPEHGGVMRRATGG